MGCRGSKRLLSKLKAGFLLSLSLASVIALRERENGEQGYGFRSYSVPVESGSTENENPRKHLTVKASLPDVPNLAQTARISLTPQEIDDFAPKIQQVVHWFGQLQAVDLDSVEPSIRADTQGYNSQEDLPRVFENRQAIVDGIPSYEEPYIKVPKVLNKE